MRTKTDEQSVMALEKVNKKLCEISAEQNAKIIMDACGGLTCESGGLNVGKLWKLKKKLKGILSEPPTAMLDMHGNLVTSSKALEELTVTMFEDRLKTLKIKNELRLH